MINGNNLSNELVSFVPLTEKLKAIPGFFGIRFNEEPAYYLIRSSGEKEIRKYGELTLASITLPIHKDYEATQAEAYAALRNYIFGKNHLSQKIAMTSAIIHEDKLQVEGGGYLTMRFILPSKYNLNNAPRPLDQLIKLHQKASQMVACRAYSGPNDEFKVQKYSLELRAWISQYSSYKAALQVHVAEYDSPGTISFLRKNEVQIDVKSSIFN